MFGFFTAHSALEKSTTGRRIKRNYFLQKCKITAEKCKENQWLGALFGVILIAKAARRFAAGSDFFGKERFK